MDYYFEMANTWYGLWRLTGGMKNSFMGIWFVHKPIVRIDTKQCLHPWDVTLEWTIVGT